MENNSENAEHLTISRKVFFVIILIIINLANGSCKLLIASIVYDILCLSFHFWYAKMKIPFSYIRKDYNISVLRILSHMIQKSGIVSSFLFWINNNDFHVNFLHIFHWDFYSIWSAQGMYVGGGIRKNYILLFNELFSIPSQQVKQ